MEAGRRGLQVLLRALPPARARALLSRAADPRALSTRPRRAALHRPRVPKVL